MKQFILFVFIALCTTSVGFAQFTTVTSGLVAPAGIEIDDSSNVLLAEAGSGTNNGRILLVRQNGDKIPIVTGLPSNTDAATGETGGPWRTMRLANNRLAVIVGEGPTILFGRIMIFNMTGFQAGVSAAKTVRDTVSTIDISRFALAQTGVTNSNPFSAVLDKDGSWYVADAGANMIVKVTAAGQRSIFATFPRTANPTPVGPPVIDAVPTKIIARPEGGFYVCTLTGFPFITGRAAIYVVSSTGVVTPYVTNMTLLTDMQLDPRTGDLYALQFGTFSLTPQPGFVFGSGRVFRIARDGGAPVLVDGTFGPGPGLALDKNGNIYVTSLFTSQLLKKSNATRCFKLDMNLTADNNTLTLYNSIKYSLTITNNDNVTATNVRVYWLPPYKRFEGDPKPFALQGSYASKGHYDSWNGYWVIRSLAPGESAIAYNHLFVLSTQLDATQIAQVANCNETNPNFPVFGIKKEEDADGTVAFRTNNGGTSATFSAHPNPADEKINVTINHDSDTEWTLRVLNATGQAVFSQKGQGSNTLNVEAKSLQNGLYIVELQAAGERKMNKIIVQH